MNYITHLLIVISAVAECIFISASALLVGIPIEITGSAIGLEFVY